jgi:hypothetical protein
MTNLFKKYVHRFWPLSLALPAVWGLFWAFPYQYRSFELSRHGASVMGWYTEVDDPELVHYAYTAGENTYGGTISQNDLGSDFYFRPAGYNSVRVRYSSRKPWVSDAGDGTMMAFSKPVAWTCLIILLFSVSFSLIQRPRWRPLLKTQAQC